MIDHLTDTAPRYLPNQVYPSDMVGYVKGATVNESTVELARIAEDALVTAVRAKVAVEIAGELEKLGARRKSDNRLCGLTPVEHAVRIALAAVPAATDPTHGLIDADIRQAVEAMAPESLAQRTALENTLQRRRDG